MLTPSTYRCLSTTTNLLKKVCLKRIKVRELFQVSSAIHLGDFSTFSYNRYYTILSGSNTSKRVEAQNVNCRQFSSNNSKDVVSELSTESVIMPEDAIEPIEDNDNAYDDENDPLQRGRKIRKSKVKVKFNWKNSLVSTDALSLLENLYQTHPQLVEFNENAVIQYLQMMSVFSIDVETAAKMVIMNPQLLQASEEKIFSSINALRTMGLNETQRAHVLRSFPEIFNFSSKKILSQFALLKTYLTNDETVQVVCKSVTLFTESESTIREKLDYLIKDMSHETKSIVKCKALSYTMRHIKTRHEFLVRCGLFKPIPYRKLVKVLEKDYKDKSKPRNKYFKPIEVVCYSDEDFLKYCTKGLLTLNELAAFEELYNAELNVTEENLEEDEELGHVNLEEEEEDVVGDAVSLVKTPNSVGFFNDVEAKSCYF